MITRFIILMLTASLVASAAFGQMRYSRTRSASPTPTPSPTPMPVPPPDVKVYLQRQIASSKDKKFHFNVNGKDLGLTPFHVWMQKSTGPNTTSTCIDMTSDEGRIYDIDFMMTGAQVTAIRIHKIN